VALDRKGIESAGDEAVDLVGEDLYRDRKQGPREGKAFKKQKRGSCSPRGGSKNPEKGFETHVVSLCY